MKIKVYSLCRSGHHAIAFWLAKNFQPNANVQLTHDDGNEVKKMVIGQSNVTLDLVENERIKESDQPSIIILRDPFNNYASFLKLTANPNFGTLAFFPFLDYWKEYANEVLANTELLKNKIFISYNDWVQSESYRRDVIKEVTCQFGVNTQFDDSLHKKMTIYGGGSSFDGLDHVNAANKMNVLERYKFYGNSFVYRKMVDTPEIKNFSEKIFGFYPFEVTDRKKVTSEQKTFQDLLGYFE